MWTFSIIFLLIVAHTKPEDASKCDTEIKRMPKDRGSPCSKDTKPKIYWYFDDETDQCLPFLYEGCGGNQNRFKTIRLCEENCIPQDYGWCALKKKAYLNADGETRICSGPDSQSCPEKYTCKHLAFFGICCPQETEALFMRNFSPSCSNGTLVTHNRGEWRSVYLGKSCADDFCPSDAECFQQEIFAFCCL